MRFVYTIILLALATCRSLAQNAVQQQQQHSIRALRQTCRENDDCNDNQFCSEGVCRDHGTCNTLIDCMNPTNSYPVIECTGFMKCEDGICGRQCSLNPCPANLPSTTCLAQPCVATKCDEPYDVCIDDYCGGCNAIFLNAAGTQVCTVEQSSSKACKANTNCNAKEEYCAQGTCRPHGYCSTVRDCQIPSNQYSVTFCMGDLICENNACGVECSGSACANNVVETPCSPAPCNVTECNEPYETCVNDYCGGCNAIFFNAAGDQVCLPKKPDNSTCNENCRGQRGYAKVLLCMMNKVIGRSPCSGSRN